MKSCRLAGSGIGFLLSLVIAWPSVPVFIIISMVYHLIGLILDIDLNKKYSKVSRQKDQIMIKWNSIQFFSQDEFSGNGARHVDWAKVDSELIRSLDEIRRRSGVAMKPSPASGALYRIDGSKTSRHYAVGRKSDAIDFFPVLKGSDDMNKIVEAVSGLFRIGGFGLYYDTRYNGPAVMCHIDLRPRRNGKVVCWTRGYHKAGEYRAARIVGDQMVTI